MTKYYSKYHEFLTIESDGTFTLNHSDMGYGMHDAERREFWVVKGNWTEKSKGVYQLNGTCNGSVSGSHTDRVNCRIVPYHTDYKDDPYNKEIDVANNWKVETSAPTHSKFGW